MAYGFCPQCGGVAVSRARNPVGPTTCENGHSFPHAQTLNQKPAPAGLSKPVTIGDVAGVAAPEDDEGALVFAVSLVDVAEQNVAAHLTAVAALSENVKVIPFGESVLAHCGRGERLFRGLILLRPAGVETSADVIAFDDWIEKSVQPYLAPNAPVMSL